MAHIKATITRITRVHCDFRGCQTVYDYTGPKSPSYAVVEAQAFGWAARSPWFVCPAHATTSPIER